MEAFHSRRGGPSQTWGSQHRGLSLTLLETSCSHAGCLQQMQCCAKLGLGCFLNSQRYLHAGFRIRPLQAPSPVWVTLRL